MTGIGSAVLAYDAENRLTDYTDGQVSAAYTYDWSGRRLSKTVGGVTTTYVYDGPHVIAEYENGSLARKYVYGPGIDMPIMMIAVDGTGETRYYYLQDRLGNVVALLNNGGAIVEAYSYCPFGGPGVHTAAGADGVWLTGDDVVAAQPSSAFGNPYMFTGRRWDEESGLYYYRARMYSPEIGRFLQPDPLMYVDGMNFYAYVNNNPVNWIDPWGLFFDQNPYHHHNPPTGNEISKGEMVWNRAMEATRKPQISPETRKTLNDLAVDRAIDWGVSKFVENAFELDTDGLLHKALSKTISDAIKDLPPNSQTSDPVNEGNSECKQE